jgi:hypothetical protein
MYCDNEAVCRNTMKRSTAVLLIVLVASRATEEGTLFVGAIYQNDGGTEEGELID